MIRGKSIGLICDVGVLCESPNEFVGAARHIQGLAIDGACLESHDAEAVCHRHHRVAKCCRAVWGLPVTVCCQGVVDAVLFNGKGLHTVRVVLPHDNVSTVHATPVSSHVDAHGEPPGSSIVNHLHLHCITNNIPKQVRNVLNQFCPVSIVLISHNVHEARALVRLSWLGDNWQRCDKACGVCAGRIEVSMPVFRQPDLIPLTRAIESKTFFGTCIWADCLSEVEAAMPAIDLRAAAAGLELSRLEPARAAQPNCCSRVL
mmetsp:Transcript_47466/g.87226  ORF Transcript_47466/g.87226 Transcript_47466/m.87226 type:complete len:260 (-) Transcript_47466:1089-1868(-)